MSVLLDDNTRLIVQGLTGREGTFHAKQAAAYGTKVVGGVTPGKGGTTHEGWPIFNTVADAVMETGANTTVIFVPPPFAADAVMEAADGGVDLAVDSGPAVGALASTIVNCTEFGGEILREGPVRPTSRELSTG